MNFASDNWAGAAPEVMQAVLRANDGYAPAYGGDALSAHAADLFAQVFGRAAGVYFTPSGTASNALCMAALARPGGLIFCADTAHILTSEHGAAEFFSGGMRLVPISTADGRIAPDALSAALERFADDGRSQTPAILSLTQITECGTAYAPGEIAALAAVAHGRGMSVHLDGARFANAAAYLGCDAAEISWRAGVDLMSFGGTKNGCLGAEAVVAFDAARVPDLDVLRKRAGYVTSKARFIAAQFTAHLTDGLWLACAAHANAMAARLAEGISASGRTLRWPVQGNMVFAGLDAGTAARLRAAGAAFHAWETAPDGGEIARLATCFATTEAEIDSFLDVLG